MDTGVELGLIAAVSKNRVIGRSGELPWRLKADLQSFKQITEGNTVVMGRITYESIVKRLRGPLPRRRNIVLTRNKDFQAPGCEVANSLHQAIKLINDKSVPSVFNRRIFVIGGAKLFQEALPLARVLFLTLVEAEVEGDAFFPEINLGEWRLLRESSHSANQDNEYPFTFKTLVRRAEPDPLFVNLKNARFEKQREIMESAERAGLCPFCPGQIDAEGMQPVIRKGRFWHLRLNRWPYASTTLHLLAIANAHAKNLRDMPPEAMAELWEHFQWAENHYELEAGAIGIRFGKPSLNGATVSHLHAHLIVADPDTKKPSYKKVRFAMGPSPEEKNNPVS